MRLFRRRQRKYPIKKDEYGRSARQRAFELFKEGKRPAQVAQLIPISVRTACRYHEDWKKLGNELPCSTFKKLMKSSPEFTEQVVHALSKNLGMTREEVILRMQQPWGLMRALNGRWPSYRLAREQSEVESRLQKALDLITIAQRFKDDPEKFLGAITDLLFNK